MAEHDDSKENYGSPKAYKADLGNNGYPNKIANTQTQRTRGCKNRSEEHTSELQSH